MVTERGSTPPESRHGHKLPAGERRQAIEEAAARLFAEHGYQSTTVEQIVAAAGVSKPMLYRHFDSKRELCARLLERRRDELAAAPLDVFLDAGDPSERLSEMIDAWFAHVEAHPHSTRLLCQDITGDPQLVALQSELRGRQRAADMALLREFGATLPDTELEPLGETIRASLTALALWWLDRPGTPRAVVAGAMVRLSRGVIATAR
jgi:AcrR family transcriptional regulator